jgi:hypothetical protein
MRGLKRCPLTYHQIEGKPSLAHFLIKVRVKELKGCTLTSHQREREGSLIRYASIFQSEHRGKTLRSPNLKGRCPHFISQSKASEQGKSHSLSTEIGEASL